MSKLRSAVLWLVLYTQIWTPVLAQTLPISVDHGVAGQKPVVGVTNGVPVVNIAPPSAGGVSNNRFTQFNVGPSGVVLNNSGAASQTQVAGQVAGNPMLGNQRATTILNQVTAPNPSQLRGMLEVAGNRANVIVANPAGITCNGCGFLNANRATLTTGKPVIGSDGTLGFDIASGRLAIEGAGLYGANLSQLDLLARTLELNAQVWADRLNVVAGSARVGYDGIDVSALAGEGAGSSANPGVSIDVAALGGMYANSIRLIGTEAGVGVNVGGNLAALTGTLYVAANGDVKILPSGRMQAATDLSVKSRGDIVNNGTAAAGGALSLNAGGKVVNHNAMSSAGNASIVARQLDNRGAFTAGLQADGSISPLGALSVQVGSLQNAGTLMAGGNAAVTADALGLSGGKLVAGGALTLDATGALTNRAGAVYGGSVLLRAASLDNTGGKVTSGGALTGRVAGAVDNTGGTLAGAGAVDLSGQSVVNVAGGVVSGDSVALRAANGINNQSGSVQANGALRVETAGALDNQGGKLLGGSADIQAASLDNRNGVAQADGKLSVTNTGALQNQGGGLYGGTADIKTASLSNTGGKVVSGGALDLGATGNLDNTGGTIAAQGQATLNAQALSNTRGIIAASGLTLKTQGVLDNSAGLLQADNVLALTAGSLNNRNTLANGIAGAGGTTAGALGLMGQQVTLNAGSVDNQAGRIGAGQDLGVTTGTLNNAAGNVSSDANAKLAFSSLANSSGALTAGNSLELTTGNLDNDGKIHAGQDLKITADTLTNRATGELIAGRNTELNINAMLANAGLIDGGYVRIGAGTLVNTGRIYGDRIGIQTPVLINDANAVIASRGDLDLGVGTLTNREHALIYAGADLRVGGTLDATGKATGQAQSLVNESATIEAERNADIAAASIQNRNLHFASETVEVSRGPKLYYRLENATEFLDGSKLWLCDAVTTACGKDPVTFLDDDSERRLLLPSDKYPESRYGPPFDYVQGVRGKEGRDAPIPPAYLPDPYVCGPGGDACNYEKGGPRYKAGDGVWRVFGVAEPVPVPPMVEVKCNFNQTCQVSTPERDQALATNEARHKELEGKIYAFNADFNNRLVKNFFYYKVEEVVMESRTISTDPAKIIVGGAAKFTGTVTNDKSRIVAGGTLSVVGPAINNLGAEGLRSIERTGSEVRTVAKGGGRDERWSDYKDVVAPERIDLAIASSDGNTALPSTGNQKPGGSNVAGPLQPAQLIEIGTPGKFVIRVPTLPPVIPTSALYRVMQAPNAPYLISTDSQFVGSRTATSSDFLLRQLNQSGSYVLKRLGDGFYEQKLVAEQVMLASGQRFVGDYTDNEAQYKALLTAGADFAGKFGLTVGTALTQEQMRHLTGDIVWLVEQTVTLPDGTQQKVLTPQVYLAVKPGDLRGDGTLIAGRDTQISTTGDVANSGTIGARNALIVDAQNVRNTVGSMQGKTVNLNARNDIDNIAGLLKGDKVALSAGRDINLQASTQSNASGGVSSTRVDGVARIDAGDLNVQAGRDINAQAAGILASGDARIKAGNNINLTTVREEYAESYNYGSKNRSAMRSTTEVGSRIVADGNLTLMAGQDVNARAAEVTSDKQLAVGAGRDITVAAGTNSNYAYNETYYKKRGFLSSKSEHRKTEADWTTSASSTFTGDTTVLMAGRDLNVVGSNVAAQNDLVMSADRNVNIVAAQNTSEEYQYEKIKKSGLGAMGGLSYGSRQQTDILEGDKVLHTASTVGSVQGNALINAGKSLNVVGSNVLAREGDVTLMGRDVTITAAIDTAREKEFHEVKQSGLSINASTPLLSAMQTASKMGDAAGKTDNKVMQGLALATTGLAGVNAYDAIQANPSTAGGLNINIDLGSSKSQSTTKRESASVRGSTVAAGRDLTVIAQGGGQASNVMVTGSNLSAGNNAAIKADGDIVLRAAQNTFEQHSTNQSTNASIGVGVTVGSQGVGFTLNVAASAARGKADGKDTSWTSSTVTAGNVLGLQSGGDTSLIGAIGQANQIVASVGNNLRIETLQDISTYASKQQSAGFAGSLCYGYCTSSISANVSQGQMKSNFKSASEQAGLKAGDGGFIVDVKNNTTLIGGLIASSDKAVADGLNVLATGTLVTENLKNSASYKASQVGISGGYGWEGLGGKDSGKGAGKDAGLGTDAKGNVASGSKAQPGTHVPQTAGGLGMGTPAVAAASGRDSSTTYSAISGGTVVIRDEVAQQNLSGMTAAETIASLNRDTSSDTLNALKPIFDKEKIEAGFEIVSEAQRQVGQFLTTRAKEAKALEDALKNEPDGPRREQLQQAFEDAKTWGPGGESRRWLTAIMGAVSGNVTGAAGDAIQAVAVNYLQGLAASQVKEIVSALGEGPQAEAARAAMHAIVGCAGAAGKGSDCGAGALGAGSGAVLNALLGGDASKMTPEEREVRRNLIGSLVAGIAQASGVSGAEAVFAAINETENNALSVQEHQARIQEKAACKSETVCERRVAKKYQEIDAENRKALAQCASVDVCKAEIEAASARLGEYGSRIANLEEKLRMEGGLSASELEEWSLLKMSASLLLDVDRNAAIKNYILLGGDQAKQLAWDEIGKAGVAGAAAAVGAVGLNRKPVAGGSGGGSPGGRPIQSESEGTKASAKDGEKSTGKNYADILSPEAKQHILHGDKPGSGGHMWPGQPGKTVFPQSWSADKIVHEIGDIATAPNTVWYAQKGTGGLYTKAGEPARWVAWEVRDEVRIRVVYEPANGKVITAFPDNNPIPPLKLVKP